MFVGTVVDYKVHDELHIALMNFGKECIKILHCSEFFHDFAVIADIIAVVIVRRIVNRAAPDCVNAERFKVIELADNALQIADSVAV